MKKYEQLEQQIEQLKAEVERLKKEEKEGALPVSFCSRLMLKLVSGEGTARDLNGAFDWASTPQGVDFWCEIGEKLARNPGKPLEDKVVIILQNWLIKFYQKVLGLG